MAVQFENFYEDTLSAAITASDTYIPLNNPPTSATEGWLLLDYDDAASREFIYYTSKDSGGVTLASAAAGRGKDGTVAVPHQKNAKVRMTLSAGLLNDILSGVVTASQAFYPVGSLYFNATVNTNPATLLGFGTWVAHATGRMLVGVDSAQTEFATLGQTGGQKTVQEHYHNVNLSTSLYASGASSTIAFGQGTTGTHPNYGTPGAPIHNAGSGVNNMNPYITVYIWKRTA